MSSPLDKCRRGSSRVCPFWCSRDVQQNAELPRTSVWTVLREFPHWLSEFKRTAQGRTDPCKQLGPHLPEHPYVSSFLPHHGAFLLQSEMITTVIFIEKEYVHPEFIANHFIGGKLSNYNLNYANLLYRLDMILLYCNYFEFYYNSEYIHIST